MGRFIYVAIILVGLVDSCHSEGFPIRLWPTNSQGTEGLVEAFYNGSWGFVGNPQDKFSDTTATYLCKILGLSQFGYSSGYTSMENYTGHSWLYGLECYGNETSIDQCVREYNFAFNNYTSLSSWYYRYGTRLYCVDSILTEGVSENTGLIETAFFDQIYHICHTGFSVNAANVVCKHLRYNGFVSFTYNVSRSTPVYNRTLLCEGNEHSLTDCKLSSDEITSCDRIVYITCRAVRFTHWNDYDDEGAVEIYHDGSWGFVGDPGFSFDDVTAKYLCETFGFPNGGFSTTAHPLDNYNRKAWLNSLSCRGNESHIMECQHEGFSFTPSLMDTYRRGTWLYCFDFNVTSIRLVNGSTSYEGKVEIEINGRWGSICVYGMTLTEVRRSSDVICRYLGYQGIDSLLEDIVGDEDEMFWMSELICSGTEDSLTDCYHIKGPITPCFDYPFTFSIQCIDIDDCLSNPCRNGGVCTDGDQSYICQCSNSTRWGDLTYDACTEAPCLNNGTCTDLLEGYRCGCVDGFNGENCQNDINDCEQMPCENGGSCEDEVNGYTCNCLNGYTGPNCQMDIDECESAPCQNEGQCTNTDGSNSCQCLNGFSGIDCKTDTDECSSSPCLNDGICENLVNEFTCHCRETFEGKYCQKEIDSQTTLVTIIVSTSSVVLVIGVAVVVFICIRNKRREAKHGLKDNTVPKTIEMSQLATFKGEQGGNLSIYNTITEKDAYEMNQEEVYDEIKERPEGGDYLTLESAEDDDGYLKPHNKEENNTAQYSKLNKSQPHDYVQLSGFQNV